MNQIADQFGLHYALHYATFSPVVGLIESREMD